MEHKVNEAQDLAFIGKMRKGGPKKGMKEQSCYSEMPVEANSIVWGCLLGACRKHNKVELGEYVAGRLFELDPKNATPYVVMSNMYASSYRWDDADNVRKSMKERGLRKMPGCSWIEVDKQVHTFLAEDMSHPQT